MDRKREKIANYFFDTSFTHSHTLGGGKTSSYEVLQNALTKLHNDGVKDPQYQIVHTFVMNPKSISMGELYGEVRERGHTLFLDPPTHSWEPPTSVCVWGGGK